MLRKDMRDYVIRSFLISVILGLFYIGPFLWGAADLGLWKSFFSVVILLLTLLLSALASQEATRDDFSLLTVIAVKGTFLWVASYAGMVWMAKTATKTSVDPGILYLSWSITYLLWVIYVILLRVVPSHWRERWGIALEEAITNRRSPRRPPLM